MNQDTMSLDGKNILSYQRGHISNFHLPHINYTLYTLCFVNLSITSLYNHCGITLYNSLYIHLINAYVPVVLYTSYSHIILYIFSVSKIYYCIYTYISDLVFVSQRLFLKCSLFCHTH